MSDKVTVHLVPDVAAFRQNPEAMFDHSADVLNQGDILFFQNERHYTSTHTTWQPDVSHTEIVPPEHALVGLKKVKWDVCSFAGNHSMDLGFDGLADTIDVLNQLGIKVIGAGKDITEARAPHIIERKGVKVGFLARATACKNGADAGTRQPGIAPMRAETLYKNVEPWNPGGEPEILTFPNADDLADLVADVKKLRSQVDVVVLSLHWGLTGRATQIPDYQKVVAHAVIDAGVDVIIGHHPHVTKGIEVYKGKVIFYSAGHFAFDMTTKVREEWMQHRPERYNKVYNYRKKFRVIEPDWLDSQHAYAEESRKTMIVKLLATSKGVERVSYIPAMINKQAQPVVVTSKDKDFAEHVDHLRMVSKAVGFDTTLIADGDEVVVKT